MNVFSPNNVLMTIVLVFLTIVLAIIVIQFLIIVAICCLFSYIIMGVSPLVFFHRRGERTDRICEGPFMQDSPRDGASTPGAGDDTIECEVISARTVENGGSPSGEQ